MSNPLLHSPADVSRRALITLGLGLLPPSTPWPISAAGEPDSPDNCITVFDTVGVDEGRSMIDGRALGHYGIQIRIRAITHVVGFAKAEAIRLAISETVYQEEVTIDGTSYLIHCFSKIGRVLSLGKESPNTRRSLFTINALVSLKALD